MELDEKISLLEARIHEFADRIKKAERENHLLRAELRKQQLVFAEQNDELTLLKKQLDEQGHVNELSGLQRKQLAERLENLLVKIESIDLDTARA